MTLVLLLSLGSVSSAAAASATGVQLRHGDLLVADYDNDVPPRVKVVVDDVLHQLGTLVAFNPKGPVEIRIGWDDIAALGLGGPVIVETRGSSYPAALADTLFGGQHAKGGIDGFVTIGSGHSWYYGLDGRPSAKQFDLRSAFAHELIHALGFTIETTARRDGVVLSGRTAQFDGNLYSQGRRLIEVGAAAQARAFADDDVWFDIGGGQLYPLESSAGRGESHFGYAVSILDNEPGAMMYGGLTNGSSRRIDAPTLGVLAQIGYPLALAPAAPTTPSADAGSVRWSINLASAVAPPTQIVVEQRRAGISERTTSVGGAVRQFGLTVPGVDTVVLTAVGANGQRSESVKVGVVGSNSIANATSLDQLVRSDDYRTEHGDVLRLYWAFFRRAPDVGGARYWISMYDSGTQLNSIATAFAGSSEFQSRYGSLDSAAYVEIIYENVLNRPRDNGGYQYWLGLLDSGRLDRGGVVRWIAAAPEFVNAHPY